MITTSQKARLCGIAQQLKPIYRLSAKTEVAPGKDGSFFVCCRFHGSQRTAQNLLRNNKKEIVRQFAA